DVLVADETTPGFFPGTALELPTGHLDDSVEIAVRYVTVVPGATVLAVVTVGTADAQAMRIAPLAEVMADVIGAASGQPGVAVLAGDTTFGQVGIQQGVDVVQIAADLPHPGPLRIVEAVVSTGVLRDGARTGVVARRGVEQRAWQPRLADRPGRHVRGRGAVDRRAFVGRRREPAGRGVDGGGGGGRARGAVAGAADARIAPRPRHELHRPGGTGR